MARWSSIWMVSAWDDTASQTASIRVTKIFQDEQMGFGLLSIQSSFDRTRNRPTSTPQSGTNFTRLDDYFLLSPKPLTQRNHLALSWGGCESWGVDTQWDCDREARLELSVEDDFVDPSCFRWWLIVFGIRARRGTDSLGLALVFYFSRLMCYSFWGSWSSPRDHRGSCAEDWRQFF